MIILCFFQRKFVRLTASDKDAFYATFRNWLGSTLIEEDMWSAIMVEEELFDYENIGIGRGVEQGVASEVEVHTDGNEGDGARFSDGDATD